MDFAQNINGFENMEPQSLWERVHSDKIFKFADFQSFGQLWLKF